METDTPMIEPTDGNGQLASICAELWPDPTPRVQTPPAPPLTGPRSNLDRAWAYILKCPEAISGQDGHGKTLRAACEFYRFGCSEEEVVEGMDRFNRDKCSPAWSPKEIDHKIKSAMVIVQKAGEFGIRLRGGSHRQAAASPASPPPTSTPPAVQVGTERPPERPHLTDVGNGQRFARRWADEVRWDVAAGVWRIWDGQRWAGDTLGRAAEMAKEVARDMLIEARAEPDPDQAKAIAKWAFKSEGRERISAMLSMAQSEVGIPVGPDSWDADPMLLNVANGTVYLETGNLRSHDPKDLITKLAPVPYDPAAESPVWLAHLARIFPDRPDVAAYLQVWHGYCLTGDISVQVMPVYHGEGANGKSTLLSIIMHVMGDYAGEAPPDLLLVRYGNEHPCELASIKGRRLVVANESEKHRKLKIGLVKRLTGDPTVTARWMKENYFTFKRTSKLILCTNNKPLVNEDTEAAWRRLRLVPFTVTIPEAERDQDIGNKLISQSPGVLRWMVEGAVRWGMHRTMPAPAPVTEATAGYRAESDDVGSFLDECCLIAPNGYTSLASLRKEYEKYCKENGSEPLRARDVADALRKRGVTDARTKHERGWSGVTLLDHQNEVLHKEDSDVR